MEGSKKDRMPEDSKFPHTDCGIKHELRDPVLETCRMLRFSKLRAYWMKLVVVSDSKEARLKFYSELALENERVRHIIGYPNAIHPLSIFISWWELIMFFTYLTTFIFLPLDMAFFDSDTTNWDYYDALRIVLTIISFCNIIISLNTGYQRHLDTAATLDFCKRFFRYVRTTLILDILMTLPVRSIEIYLHDEDHIIWDVLNIMKLLCLFRFFHYLKKILTRWNVDAITIIKIKLVISIFIFLFWVTSLQFIVDYWSEGSKTSIRNDSITWFATNNLLNQSDFEQFSTGFYRAVRLFTLQGYNEAFPRSVSDEIFITIVWIISAIIHCVTIWVFVLSSTGSNASQSNYYVMINEISAYMDKNELPKNLRKKILQYFETCYNDYYFDEKEILTCHAGRLRQDVMVHLCSNVVKDVPFLQCLPVHLLMSIISNIKLETFIKNEVILRIDTIGDCMYFIVRGTVAVYNRDGQMVCRLQDGDHFGEMALLGGSNRKRLATVIASESCEMCRLDRHHFQKVVDVFPDIMIALASQSANRLT